MEAKARVLTTKEFNKYRNFLPKDWYSSKKWFLQGENGLLIYDLETQTIRPPKSTDEKAFFTEMVEISFPHNYKTGDWLVLNATWEVFISKNVPPLGYVQLRGYIYINDNIAFGKKVFRAEMTIAELESYLKSIQIDRF